MGNSASRTTNGAAKRSDSLKTSAVDEFGSIGQSTEVIDQKEEFTRGGNRGAPQAIADSSPLPIGGPAVPTSVEVIVDDDARSIKSDKVILLAFEFSFVF